MHMPTIAAGLAWPFAHVDMCITVPVRTLVLVARFQEGLRVRLPCPSGIRRKAPTARLPLAAVRTSGVEARSATSRCVFQEVWREAKQRSEAAISPDKVLLFGGQFEVRDDPFKYVQSVKMDRQAALLASRMKLDRDLGANLFRQALL